MKVGGKLAALWRQECVIFYSIVATGNLLKFKGHVYMHYRFH